MKEKLHRFSYEKERCNMLYRVIHNKNYTTINNTIVTDNRLSWKAKGIWLYAFSRPDDWVFHLNDLINKSTDGRDSVKAGLIELEQSGYLKRFQHRLSDGSFGSAEWTFFETPQLKESLPKTENPISENPITEKRTLQITECLPITEKQQHAAVVPSDIKSELNLDIPLRWGLLATVAVSQNTKEHIVNKYNSTQIKKALEYALHPSTKINKTLDQCLIWACEKQPDPPKDPIIIEKENKEFAKACYKALHPKFHDKVKFEILHKHIELYYIHGNHQPIVINYDEKGFKEQLENALRKFGDRSWNLKILE